MSLKVNFNLDYFKNVYICKWKRESKLSDLSSSQSVPSNMDDVGLIISVCVTVCLFVPKKCLRCVKRQRGHAAPHIPLMSSVSPALQSQSECVSLCVRSCVCMLQICPA